MNGDRTHLLIPIHVDALVVSGNDRNSKSSPLKNLTVSAAPNYSLLEKGYKVGPDLRQPLDERKLEPGIHLHFRLPAAVAHGDLKKETAFPRIPNRWLVQRYYKTKQGGSLSTKAWIVYSDKKATEAKDVKSAVVLLVSPPAGASAETRYDTPFSYRPTGVAKVICDGDQPVYDDGGKPIYAYGSDDKVAEVGLTAITGGDAGFSAHYPACRSILGFYDDLDKVPLDAKLSYLVTGWYSGTGDDPWSALVSGLTVQTWAQLSDKSKAKINEWMEERGCVKDFGNENFKNKALPVGMLCHGTVKDVDRSAEGSAPTTTSDPFIDFEDPRQYWVDLGNTSAEAFAARVAKERTSGKNSGNPVDLNLLEDLVTALQIGLFSQGSNAAEMDAELHRQGFAAVGGGKKWVIQQASAFLPENGPPSPPAGSPPLPANLQILLDVLNGLEREWDRHERLFRDYRWELYALWHRWTDAVKRGSKLSQNQLMPNLDALKRFVEVYKAKAEKAGQDRDEAKNAILALAGLSGALADPVQYSLVEQPAAPFYAPKDPVLLLTGPAAQATGTRSRPDSVTVRATREEMQSFSYDRDQERDVLFEATDNWLEDLGVSPEYLNAIPPWSKRLLKETLLLDEMEEYYPPETTYPPDERSRKNRETKAKVGVLPDDFSRFLWEHNPWIPLYLDWAVSWQADEGGDIEKHWILKHGEAKQGEQGPPQFRRNTELTPVLPPKQPCYRKLKTRLDDSKLMNAGSGEEWLRALLNSGMKQTELAATGADDFLAGKKRVTREELQEFIKTKQVEVREYKGLSFVGRPLFNLQYARAEAGSKLLELMQQIDKSLGSRPSAMISQPLGGLHDALIMRRAGDQLPPLDYLRYKEKKLLYLDRIGEVLGKDFHPDSSPVLNPPTGMPFCPLRTGLLELKDLWIIDVFGQRIRIQPGKLPSERGKSPALCQSGRFSSENPPAAHLYPRFCRPMRLEFTAEAPATSPGSVCGWVVLNRFDQNLVLYAADGRPVGILQKRFADKGDTFFYWVAVPGAKGAEAEVSGIQDPYLRDFANFVRSLSFAAGSAFADLINDAVEATEQRVPEDNPLISVLIGRPLALVRAELRLEMDGLPALDEKQSWTGDPKSGEPSLDEVLQTSLSTATRPRPNRFMKTNDVETVRWPVRLGDRRSTNDGLVGFFKGAPPSKRDGSNLGSHPFYALWGFDFGNQAKTYVGLQPDQDLELDCDKTLQVTLLMDPQARVHVTSGFLPKMSLELSAAQLKGSKQVREVFFQTAPVLGTPTTPHVPKPSDDYGQWSWAYRPNVTGWAEDPNMVSAAELAGPAVGWPTLTEGWLKLKIEPVLIRSLWMKSPAQKPRKNTTTNVVLAWSLHGADSVEVFRLDPDGTEKSEKKWSQLPELPEWTSAVTADTTFRLRASNKAGYEDYKDIEIQTAE